MGNVYINYILIHILLYYLAVTQREIRIIHSLLYIIKHSPSGYGKIFVVVTCRNRNFFYFLSPSFNLPKYSVYVSVGTKYGYILIGLPFIFFTLEL